MPCALPQGSYILELPETPAPGGGAVIFVHGYGSSGEGTMRNRGMVDGLLGRGYAVIAPDGTPMLSREGRSWAFRPEPGTRDDIAFLKSVRDDAARRFALDPGRMLLAGFSVGGSMVSYLACADPGAFPAYAPVSGGFWRPHPDGCAGAVRLLHTHGWTDRTVPLEGRILGGGSLDDPDVFAQGDIFRTMEIWRQANGCDALRADAFDTDPPFWRRLWTRCTPGSALELALFPGDHRIPQGWADLALDWFEGLSPPPRP
jgi:polyhydroxybutyrate depolymerase